VPFPPGSELREFSSLPDAGAKRRNVVIKLAIAIVAGLLAAYGTYRFASEAPPADRSDTGQDASPGPMF